MNIVRQGGLGQWRCRAQGGRNILSVCLSRLATLHTFFKLERKIRGEFDLNRDTTRQMIRDSPYHELEQSLVK